MRPVGSLTFTLHRLIRYGLLWQCQGFVAGQHLNRAGLIHNYVTGWWYTYPSEQYESQLGVGMMKFPTEWANKIHVPNHQPGYIVERPTLPHFYAIIPYMDGFFVGKCGVQSPNNDPYFQATSTSGRDLNLVGPVGGHQKWLAEKFIEIPELAMEA